MAVGLICGPYDSASLGVRDLEWVSGSLLEN